MMVEKYRKYKEELKRLYYAMNVIAYDCTTDCPTDGKGYSYDVQEYLDSKALDITLSSEYKNTLYYLNEHNEGLTDIECKAIKKECKMLDKLSRVPDEEIRALGPLINRATDAWENGRKSLDFTEFEKVLGEVVEYNKRYIGYLSDERVSGYDVLLDDMEDDFTVSRYDEFFDLIESEIVPLAKRVIGMPKKYDERLDDEVFDIPTQRLLTEFIAEKMGYTKNVGCIRETIHPFTNGLHNKDVRITTFYNEKLLFSNLYSVMHEIGHALYELQNDEKLNGTNLFGGASCALHESQSRFYENYVGRSEEFILSLCGKLRELYPEVLSKYSDSDIYYYVNDVSNQLIRVEADELTYPIHVLIRYRIEKMLFNGEITVSEISNVWDDLFERYLGNRPTNKKEGCYQDIHWTSGFGYFPTYALGSAMSAQFLHAMKKDLNFTEVCRNMDFKSINAWLYEHVHKYGASLKNLEVIKLATGEDFNPRYYIDYLKEKFGKIYKLN